jgi:Holliday junction resolvase RusA-like endonuclease
MTAAPTAGQQTLRINGWLPEQMANGSHGHWSVRQRKLSFAQGMVLAYARNQRWRRVQGRARLTIVLVFPNHRRRDTDGLYARVKGCVDGLVRGGYIEDDNADVLDLHVRAEVRPGQRATELTLEAAP